MSDLINRQAAIEAARDWYEGLICGSFKGLEKRLRALPSAQPDLSDYSDRLWRAAYERGKAEAEPRWIPVEERLPIEEFEEGRKNGTVYDLYPCLVTRYSTHTDKPRTRTYVCKSYFDGEDFMLHGGYAPDERSDTENTLAWMPLPKPYERSGDV